MTNITKKSHLKTTLSLLIIVITITAIALYVSVFQHLKAAPPKDLKIAGLYLLNSQPINEFKLTDNKGLPFDQTHLKGHWSFVFFGFTNCGMVCPTTMAELNKLYLGLEKELPVNQLPQVLFVSVDPDRDTVKRLNDYVLAFNPHFIGLRGDDSQIEALKKQLHIVSAKMQADGEGKDRYTIDHSAEIIVFNPDAKVQAFMSYPHTAEQMRKDYKLIIANTPT
jgi:protein SCO1/2